MEPSVFDYMDFRAYLRDVLAYRKAQNPAWSHRMVAEKVGLKSGGHISLILNGKANLKEVALEAFIRILNQRDEAASYFRNLVLYNQARTHEEQKRCYQRLIACAKSQVQVLQSDQYAYYSRWYYSALREILNIVDFSGHDAESLGQQLIPAIGQDQVLEAIELLTNLGLIQKNSQGFWKPTQQLLSTGKMQLGFYFNEHVYQVLEHAKGAIQRIPPGEKYNSWISMSINPQSLPLIVEELRATRQRILKIVEKDENAQRLFHLNLNIFPMSQIIKPKRKKP